MRSTAWPNFRDRAVKVARHAGPDCDPDLDENRIVGDDYRSTVRQFLRGHIPAGRCADRVRPKFAFTPSPPEEQFLVDFLPVGPT